MITSSDFFKQARNKSVGISITKSINCIQVFALSTGCLIGTTTRLDFAEYLHSIDSGFDVDSNGVGYITESDPVVFYRAAESTFFGHPYQYYPAIICP